MDSISTNIGGAAQASGVSAKMIRHYEAIGLITKPARTFSNYRTYSERDIHTLRFIKQARKLGFSMKQISVLLSLWQNRERPSREVKSVALQHIQELDEKIAEMQAMKATLERLVKHCRGDERPDCPILDGLAAP
ncbi:MAG: Cu(I)-responsive transcriptional regulator [Sulfuriferula sp.]